MNRPDAPDPRTALARFKEVQEQCDIADGTKFASMPEGELLRLARDLPAAALLGRLGEVERLRAERDTHLALLGAVAAEYASECTCEPDDPDYAPEGYVCLICRAAEHVRVALSAPAPDGEARPDGR
jgi:hypothetical protein